MSADHHSTGEDLYQGLRHGDVLRLGVENTKKACALFVSLADQFVQEFGDRIESACVVADYQLVLVVNPRATRYDEDLHDRLIRWELQVHDENEVGLPLRTKLGGNCSPGQQFCVTIKESSLSDEET